MIKHIGKTDYYDIDDGGEITKAEAKKDYQIVDKKIQKFTTNLTRYYGYHYIQIETHTENYCKRKPKQLQLF